MSEITFHIEGIDKDDGNVRLNVFVDQLTVFRKLLNAADAIVSKKRQPTSYYKITNLSHNSPAALTLSGEPLDEENNHTEKTFKYVIDGLRQIRTQKVAPDDASENFINSANDLLNGLNNKYSRMWLDISDGSKVNLDTDLAKAIKGLMSGYTTSFGTIKGEIETFSGHTEPYHFNLYHPLGGQAVKCIFKKNLKELAGKAVNKSVTVTGMLRYRPEKYFPYECQVKEIHIHPLDSELPTLGSLGGIASNATGETDTLEFIKKVRDEWQH